MEKNLNELEKEGFEIFEEFVDSLKLKDKSKKHQGLKHLLNYNKLDPDDILNIEMPPEFYHKETRLFDLDNYHFYIDPKTQIIYFDLEEYLEILNRKYRYFIFYYGVQGRNLRKSSSFIKYMFINLNQDENFKKYMLEIKSLATGDYLEDLRTILFKDDLNYMSLEELQEVFHKLILVDNIGYSKENDILYKTNLTPGIISIAPHLRKKLRDKKDDDIIQSMTSKIKKAFDVSKFSFYPPNSPNQKSSFDNNRLFVFQNDTFYWIPQALLYYNKKGKL